MNRGLMVFHLIVDLLLWIFLWSALWFGFSLLNKIGVDYIRRFYFTIVYFLSVSILILFFFWGEFSRFVRIKFNLIPFILIPVLFVFNALAYKFIRLKFKRPKKLINDYRGVFFLKLDDKYLVSKSFEIFFQQVLIVLLVALLQDHGFSLFRIMIVFALLFGIAHAYLIHSKGRLFGSFFIVSSVLSAVIFPFLIIRVPWGFVYSYFVHWLFYIFAAFLFWSRK